jgi:hypothetical protein
MRHLAAKRSLTPRVAESDEQNAIGSACAEKQHGLSLTATGKRCALGNLQQSEPRGKLQKQNNKTPAPKQSAQVNCESRNDHLGKTS